jgi:membrane-associated phospholipid phosphatase
MYMILRALSRLLSPVGEAVFARRSLTFAVIVFGAFSGNSVQAQVAGRAVAGGRPQTAESRVCDVRSIVPNIAIDQKNIWTFPVRLVRGKHLVPTLSVLAVTGALIAADPHDSSYFRRTTSFSGFNSAFNGTATAIGMALVPVSFYAAGLARSDSKSRSTAWLAAEAVADSEIVGYVFKTVDRRLTPSGFGRRANLSDNWWDSNGSPLGASGSFPSGHTLAAFSVATVVARRYGNHRWVPFVAYGLAAAVGFSRITTSSHYPSDVFLGAVLGYGISRFVVLRQ